MTASQEVSVRRILSLPVCRALSKFLLGILLVTGNASAAAPTYALPAMTTPDFCTRVQKLLEGTALESRNVIHTVYEEFTASKPDIRPLTTHQYLQMSADPSPLPLRLSCKLKSGDHIDEIYGANSASTQPRLCRDAHQQMVLAVWASMTRREMLRAKFNPDTVMLDGDDIRFVGPGWIAPYESYYLGENKRLHLRAKALNPTWKDWRWKIMPARLRGTHYCHLVAPEAIRALMLGDLVAAPATPN
jgi:hypothetical protein